MTGRSFARPSKTDIRGELDAEPRLSWLLRRKVAVPDRTAGYLHRSGLVERAMPTRNRLTVLIAPGGFGKTTLLAECCRRLAGDNVVTAWLSIDDSDEAEVLDSYVTFAFQYAGLSVEATSERSGGAERRVGMLVRALEARSQPFVLALDDLHRLQDPGAVAIVDFLVRRGPPNLHLAAACRRLPAGLDVGGPVLDGQAEVIATDDLRFTQVEIGDFFDRRLSRRELASLTRESAGWPMALRIHRNSAPAAAGTGETLGIVGNWVESRLWEGIDPEDRELLLDIGLFEWMDAALLHEVLGEDGSLRRVQAMDALVGFLEPVRSNAPDAWRLHPLIREHCAAQRFREARQRYREVHRRIAVALARRGETLLALRHAERSGATELAGDILEQAGGIRLWLRHGIVHFRAAMDTLGPRVLAARPRLRLAHCAALVFSNQLKEARSEYAALEAEMASPSGVPGDDAFERWVDFCILRGNLALYGGAAVGSTQVTAACADYGLIADTGEADPVVRGYAEHGLCIYYNVTAQFEAAVERAKRARRCFHGSSYARMMVEIQLGQVAMAQGQVAAARNCYAAVMRFAKASYLHEPVWVALATVLQRELDLERDSLPRSTEPPGIPASLTRNGTPFAGYAAACGVAIGRAQSENGVEAALALLESTLEFVRGAELVPLVRYLAAMQVSLLVVAGRTGEAGRAWQTAGLPQAAEACLDLDRQTWREMEALAGARLRLLIARNRFNEAHEFAGALVAASAARGLRRTQMRALALTVGLKERARDPAGADRHLAEFLALFAETDYARPAILERRFCAPALERFLDNADDATGRGPAEALLSAMRRADAGPALALSRREQDILQRLNGQGDKQIAADLGLTTHGVRYHLRNLFSKLDARTRRDAIRRARELGLMQRDA